MTWRSNALLAVTIASIVSFLGLVLCFTPPTVLAAPTDPIEIDVSVSATVPGQAGTPPPSPVLIQPENNAYLNAGVVTFRWYQVTGSANPLDHYEFSLNGQQVYNLPLTAQTTSNYIYTLNNGIYNLQLLPPAQLANGTYTWKVRVVDSQNLGTDSATWTFTVDSSAPPLVVTNVDGTNYNISATDPSTLPESQIIVTHSQPYIYGSTESYATVQLAVTRASGEVNYFSMTATPDGHFLLWLPNLNANELVSIVITAIDLANNSTVLSGVQIQYVPPTIRIPLPGIVPGLPPTIEIPIPALPVIPPSLIPGASPVVRPSPPISPGPILSPQPMPTPVQIFERPQQSVIDLRFFIFLGLMGYIVALLWLTGNQITSLPAFTFWILRFWLWGFRAKHRLVKLPELVGVPGLRYEVRWLKGDNTLRTYRAFSGWSGEWWSPETGGQMASLVIQREDWSFAFGQPTPGLASDQQWLTADSWYVGQATGKSQVPVLFPGTQIWVPLQLTQTHWPQFLRFLPRVMVIITLLIALWATYFVPTLWSFVLLGFIVWVLVRDILARIPQRLMIYGN